MTGWSARAHRAVLAALAVIVSAGTQIVVHVSVASGEPPLLSWFAAGDSYSSGEAFRTRSASARRPRKARGRSLGPVRRTTFSPAASQTWPERSWLPACRRRRPGNPEPCHLVVSDRVGSVEWRLLRVGRRLLQQRPGVREPARDPVRRRQRPRLLARSPRLAPPRLASPGRRGHERGDRTRESQGPGRRSARTEAELSLSHPSAAAAGPIRFAE